LHDFIGERVISKYVLPGLRAADLGSGSGAMAIRLKDMGCEVIAADRSANGFAAELPHRTIDFNQTDFASALGNHAFGLFTAIELIEHVEGPIGFLRNIGRLLSSGGVAILTTPNVDSLPAHFKFFFHGIIRTMDEHSETDAHFGDLF
jgi:2-polyprenyl-3-methyl-5-hydroxy-6-metoxy-1,4-benzoquinol methylase